MNHRSNLRVKRSFSKGFITLLAFFFMACSTISQTPDTVIAPSSYTAHVAFAGGGWRAHTGHSAWTMSLLENGNKTLNDVFKNVGTISSNSGGSWFSTMLMYSNKFVTAIQAPNAINTWTNASATATGWIGQQQYLFDQAPCHALSGTGFLACVFAYYTGSPLNATYWDKMVKDLVFLNNQVTGTLSGPRQSWAQGKPLLLAATMLTTDAVLSQVGWALEKQYYQACQSPSVPIMNAHKGGSCRNQTPPIPDVTPVTFSSVPTWSGYRAPPFFSALNSRQPEFNLGYTENASVFTPGVYTASISNPVNTQNVPVMIAAAASSAAGGFAASQKVTKNWELSYGASDEALNFQLNGPIAHLYANGKSAQTLAADKIVQIADGGAVDNSGVAQLLSFLQQNNQANGFNIVAFDNVQEIYNPTNVPVVAAGIDIANLFGRGIQNGNEVCVSGYCVHVPKLQIFKVDSLLNTGITWQAIAPSDNPPKIFHRLIYTKYQVTTIDNSNFGIKAGSTGTLHAFTAAWSDADTAPQNTHKDQDFKAYADMLRFINTGLQQPYGPTRETGLSHLQKAMGIK